LLAVVAAVVQIMAVVAVLVDSALQLG